ncbi:MAG TPA: methyltransferase domain-containing protein [Thermoleophilaceae bacterium]|jgi:ubiquinone/menaquinone biosynthesis C-methylase UbiE|nr:methyltransferase domain-containing protein [Thermoleophilaceae bacterium]
MRDDLAFKARQRAMWASGDYHAFATASLWEFGPILVEACGISPGQLVLDVAAGTGNVAIRAAEAGAVVVASDLTPENFDAGRREAAAHGVDIEWVEADAEALPFGDAEFDVVTSAFGAIFAPDHRAVADELLRVCRPGGTIGLSALVPSDAALEMFELMTRYPPAPLVGEESPLLWGSEGHVHELFDGRVASLTLERRALERSPFADVEFFEEHHPVLVTLRRQLAGDPDRMAAFNRALADIAGRWRRDAQEVLLIVARKNA